MTVAAAIVTDRSWIDVAALDDIPLRGARRIRAAGEDLALFRTSDDRVFALRDQCPHKQGPLSDGIVCGHAVACPLHNWLIDLETGRPLGADADKGLTPTTPVMVQAGRVFISADG